MFSVEVISKTGGLLRLESSTATVVLLRSSNRLDVTFIRQLSRRASRIREVRLDNQLGRNEFDITQGIAHLRKHAFARRFAEELRDKEHMVASFDLITKLMHETFAREGHLILIGI